MQGKVFLCPQTRQAIDFLSINHKLINREGRVIFKLWFFSVKQFLGVLCHEGHEGHEERNSFEITSRIKAPESV
jgi:hypothetical protein